MSSSSTLILILVDVSLTTVATLRLPLPRVSPVNDSTTSPPDSTSMLNGLGPSSSVSSVMTWMLMSASGSRLSTAIGSPSARSAAGISRRDGSPDGAVFGTRTMYASAPPLAKYPYTESGSIAPGVKLPYRFSNWVQLVISLGARPSGSAGSSVGKRSVKPTNAATAVGAADSTFWVETTSSTYTPGAV